MSYIIPTNLRRIPITVNYISIFIYESALFSFFWINIHFSFNYFWIPIENILQWMSTVDVLTLRAYPQKKSVGM